MYSNKQAAQNSATHPLRLVSPSCGSRNSRLPIDVLEAGLLNLPWHESLVRTELAELRKWNSRLSRSDCSPWRAFRLSPSWFIHLAIQLHGSQYASHSSVRLIWYQSWAGVLVILTQECSDLMIIGKSYLMIRVPNTWSFRFYSLFTVRSNTLLMYAK